MRATPSNRTLRKKSRTSAERLGIRPLLLRPRRTRQGGSHGQGLPAQPPPIQPRAQPRAIPVAGRGRNPTREPGRHRGSPASPASRISPATSVSERFRAIPKTRNRSTEGRVDPDSQRETVPWLYLVSYTSSTSPIRRSSSAWDRPLLPVPRAKDPGRTASGCPPGPTSASVHHVPMPCFTHNLLLNCQKSSFRPDFPSPQNIGSINLCRYYPPISHAKYSISCLPGPTVTSTGIKQNEHKVCNVRQESVVMGHTTTTAVRP